MSLTKAQKRSLRGEQKQPRERRRKRPKAQKTPEPAVIRVTSHAQHRYRERLLAADVGIDVRALITRAVSEALAAGRHAAGCPGWANDGRHAFHIYPAFRRQRGKHAPRDKMPGETGHDTRYAWTDDLRVCFALRRAADGAWIVTTTLGRTE